MDKTEPKKANVLLPSRRSKRIRVSNTKKSGQISSLEDSDGDGNDINEDDTSVDVKIPPNRKTTRGKTATTTTTKAEKAKTALQTDKSPNNIVNNDVISDKDKIKDDIDGEVDCFCSTDTDGENDTTMDDKDDVLDLPANISQHKMSQIPDMAPVEQPSQELPPMPKQMYQHPPPLLQAMNHPRKTLNELATEEAGLETALSKLNETMGRVNTVQKEIQNVISEVQQHSGYIGSNTNPLSISNNLAGKYPPPSQILLQEGAQIENPIQMASRLASLVGKNNNIIQFDQQHGQDLLEHIIAPNDEQIGDILVKLASSTQIFPPSAAQAGANAIKSLFNSLMGSIESNIENENSNETNIKRLEIILFFLGSVVKNLHQPSSVILQIGSNKNGMNDKIDNPNPNRENTPSRRRNECNDEIYNTLTQQRQQAYHSYNDVLQICQQCFEEYTKTRPTKW
jgi:hypothetical protein